MLRVFSTKTQTQRCSRYLVFYLYFPALGSSENVKIYENDENCREGKGKNFLLNVKQWDLFFKNILMT
jgi:hypothetical protein